MANLKLKNPSGGSLNLVSADGASDLTVTFPATTGTAMVSGNMPAFSVYRSGNQSISNGTYTKIAFNVEEFDTANAFDSTTNYRFTPQVAGYYQINLSAYTAGSGINNTQGFIYKNGSNYKGTVNAGSISVSDWNVNVQSLVYMNGSTDYIEGYVYVTGSSLVVASGSTSSYMSGVLVRSA